MIFPSGNASQKVADYKYPDAFVITMASVSARVMNLGLFVCVSVRLLCLSVCVWD